MTCFRLSKKWRLRIAAIGLAVLPFLALEIGLQLFWETDDQQKLSQGVKPTVPLFSFNEESQSYQTSLVYQQFFAEVSFHPQRSTNSSNADDRQRLVFVLGGSTVQGRPFGPETAFPRWAEHRLNDEGRPGFRVVNCGGVSFASDRLSGLLPELLSYKPDLIVLATGHNEFLEDHTYAHSKNRDTGKSGLAETFGRLKTVEFVRQFMADRALPAQTREVPRPTHELNARLDNEAGYDSYHYDLDWHEAVVKQFHDGMAGMIQQCYSADVPLIIVELADNSRDCAPFKSEHSSRLKEEARQTWDHAMSEAESLMKSGDWETAVKWLQKSVAASPEHALSHFRLARCLRAIGRLEEAAEHFRMAVDLDVCPLRMKSELRQTMKMLVEQHQLAHVDCPEIFMRLSSEPETGFGFDLFLDHVHPSISAHQAIGISLAAQIEQILNLPPRNSDSVSHDLSDPMGQLSSTYFSNGRRRIGWLEGWARAKKTSSEIMPMTVGDVANRVRRRLELRDADGAIELIQELRSTESGDDWLNFVARDFVTSGQDEVASRAGQPDKIGERNESTSEPPIWRADHLLTEAQRVFVIDVLKTSDR